MIGKLCLLSLLGICYLFNTDALPDCSARDGFLDTTNPNSSILIQSFYTAFSAKGAMPNYPIKWGPATWLKWKNTMDTELLPLIMDNTKTLADKHQQISVVGLDFTQVKIATNKTAMVCVPILTWGTFGDYLQCK